MPLSFLSHLSSKPDPLAAATDLIRQSGQALTEADCAGLYDRITVELQADPALATAWQQVHPEFAHYSFREAAGYEPHPLNAAFRQWQQTHRPSLATLFPEIRANHIVPLDLTPDSPWLAGMPEGEDLDLFQQKIDQLQAANPGGLIAGGYLEPRKLYTTDAYLKQGNDGPEYRSVHLGIDYWLPAGTAVHALYDGVVVCSTFQPDPKEYGGLVILRPMFDDHPFFSLYGHLSERTVVSLREGDFLLAGDRIGELGPPEENGQWVPHLHLQLMLSLLGYRDDFPGVAYPKQVRVWESICPDPKIPPAPPHSG